MATSRSKVAVVGYGNVGRCAVESILIEPDMKLAGVVEVPAFVTKQDRLTERDPIFLQNVTFVSDIEELGKVDVAILCCPSRAVRKTAESILKRGIRTVDSFDIHNDIPTFRMQLDQVAREHDTVSILSAGWDPGVDSVIRGWFQAMAPRGITYTNYGPGLSMGHSVAVRAIKGVRDGISITVRQGWASTAAWCTCSSNPVRSLKKSNRQSSRILTLSKTGHTSSSRECQLVDGYGTWRVARTQRRLRHHA